MTDYAEIRSQRSRELRKTKENQEVDQLLDVRCPFCRRLITEASVGSHLRVKCARCKSMFELVVQRVDGPE